MERWITIGAINGFLAVALGAFGAHGLKKLVTPELLVTFETGARYHLVHALALVAVGFLAHLKPSSQVDAAGWAFQAGIVLFSGSLYALTLSGVRVLGAITPFGGVAFLAGWVLLALAARK